MGGAGLFRLADGFLGYRQVLIINGGRRIQIDGAANRHHCLLGAAGLESQHPSKWWVSA